MALPPESLHSGTSFVSWFTSTANGHGAKTLLALTGAAVSLILTGYVARIRVQIVPRITVLGYKQVAS